MSTQSILERYCLPQSSIFSHEFQISLYQARTDAEREESDDEEVVEEMEEEPEDDIPYNPKNLPLGWDGKPIPYWLYKLHGLNISYNCEICGNYTYKVSTSWEIKPILRFDNTKEFFIEIR